MKLAQLGLSHCYHYFRFLLYSSLVWISLYIYYYFKGLKLTITMQLFRGSIHFGLRMIMDTQDSRLKTQVQCYNIYEFFENYTRSSKENGIIKMYIQLQI